MSYGNVICSYCGTEDIPNQLFTAVDEGITECLECGAVNGEHGKLPEEDEDGTG